MTGSLWLAGSHRSLLGGPAVAWFARKHGIPVLFGVDPAYACHPVWRRVLNAYGWFTGVQWCHYTVTTPIP